MWVVRFVFCDHITFSLFTSKRCFLLLQMASPVSCSWKQIIQLFIFYLYLFIASCVIISVTIKLQEFYYECRCPKHKANMEFSSSSLEAELAPVRND